MRAFIWVVLMVLWLVGLLVGIWWYWPIFTAGTFSTDMVAAFIYLFIGALAWLVALSLGRQRYWPR